MTTGATELEASSTGPAGALPVVLIHGFPFDRRMWEPQVRALKGRFRLLTYDVRGLGRSRVGDGQYTMELYVDDLMSVLDGMGVDRAVGCGLSMGGYILLRALEREPERFLGAVLCDTRSQPDTDEGRIERARTIRRLKEEGHDPFLKGFVPRVLAPATLRDQPDVVERVEAMARDTSIRGMCGALLAMAARTDTTPSLGRIRVPVLVLVGERDALTDPEVAREMADRIPEADLRVLPGAGHLSNLERPEGFNRALGQFLERVEAR